MTMKLYEINDAIEELFLKATDRETGEIDMVSIAEGLADLSATREEKVLNTACYIMGLRAEAASVDAIADSIEEQAQTHRRRADVLKGEAARVEEYLKDQIEAGEEFRDARVRIRWRKSERVECSNVDTADPNFVRTTKVPMKSAAKSMIKAGAAVQGFRIIERNNIQIKP